jgi:hypothetical protein
MAISLWESVIRFDILLMGDVLILMYVEKGFPVPASFEKCIHVLARGGQAKNFLKSASRKFAKFFGSFFSTIANPQIY